MKRSGCKVSKSVSALRKSCEKVLFESLEQRVCLSSSMMLTAAGASAGFTLTPFASNFPTYLNAGPLGIAFPSTGSVLVTDAPGNIRVFSSHADGQSAASATVASSLGNLHAIGLAQLGSNIYMTDQASGKVLQLNNNGTVNRTVAAGVNQATGIVANPFTGHLYVSEPGLNTIVDVNPSTGSVTKLLTNVPHPDGLTLSPDGKTLYVAAAGTEHILGYDTSTKAVVYDSGLLGDVDGAALGGGTLAGNLFVNTNSGELIEINLATNAKTILATGGSRGDFVSVDPADYTLLITQSDCILRLGPGPFIPGAGAPSIGYLSATPNTITQGNNVTLTATNVTASHGSVTGVSFYLESNNLPGLQTGANGDTLISTDTTSSNGFTATAPTSSLTAGNYTYYAQAIDSFNTLSNVVSTSITVQSAPTIGSLSANPAPVMIGNNLTLTAAGANASASSVGFYMESNNTPGLQTGANGDILLGTDASAADGFACTMNTTGMHAGLCTFYAQAANSQGALSNIVSATDTLNNAAPTALNLTVNTTMDTPLDINVPSDVTPTAQGASLDLASVALVSSTNNGMLIINKSTGHVTYWPAEDFTGADSFQFTIKDSLGDISNAATVTINVTPGQPIDPIVVVDDPCDCGNSSSSTGGTTTPGKALVILGTNSDDHIKVETRKGGQLEIEIQSKVPGQKDKKIDRLINNTFSRIIVFGMAGNDNIEINKVATPAWLFGGAGNDHLQIQGGSGHAQIQGGSHIQAGSGHGGYISASSLLVGGDGNDNLDGSNANDLLIGGRGKDELHARGGNDILVAGYTDYDKNLAALCDILCNWNSSASYNDRVSQLAGTLNSRTVHADGQSNHLIGDKGNDWFFANTNGVGNNGQKDKIDGGSKGETVTNIVL